MTVMCQIVRSDRGCEGIIQQATTNQTVYNTGLCECPEDAESMMESTILRNKWDVVPNPINFPAK